MKPNIAFSPGTSRFKTLAIAIVLAALTLVGGGGVACGGSGVGVGSQGGGGALELVPDNADVVGVLYVDKILRQSPTEQWQWFKLYEDSFEEAFDPYRILIEDINTWVFVISSSCRCIFSILEGHFDFEEIRDVLDNRGLDDEDYRGYELWGDMALLEDDGYVIFGHGDSAGVKDMLKSLARDEGFLVKDKENPLKRVLDRVGTAGQVTTAIKINGCVFDFRRCNAAGGVLDTDDKFTVEMTDAFLFASERTAELAVSEVDDRYEDMQDSVRSLDYEVKNSGEFVVVKTSIDDDDSPEYADYLKPFYEQIFGQMLFK